MIKLRGRGPLYRQLYETLRAAIIAGHYRADEKLPSSRALAKTLKISRNVVIVCYEQLSAEGFLRTKTGAGSFVCPGAIKLEKKSRTSVPPSPRLSRSANQTLKHWQQYGQKFSVKSAPEFDFRYGEVGINQTLMDDITRLTRRGRVRLKADYQHPAGLRDLRESIARYVQRNRNCVCHPDQIIISSGSQQALDLIARLLLNQGDRVMIEDPCYRGARQAFDAAGAQAIACRVDEQGLDPSSFPGVDPLKPVKLIYSTPSHQFPTGAVLSLPRRLALLRWAEENSVYIIEDDYDSEFRYTGQPIEAIQGMDKNQRTIYVGTFSKLISPSLRIGYMVLPEALVEPMLALKWCSDRSAPMLTQSLMADFLNAPLFARHLKRMRICYAHRREILIKSLEKEMEGRITVQGTMAGIHLLAWLNNHRACEASEILELMYKNGIGIDTVNKLYTQSVSNVGLLIGYSNIYASKIPAGVKRLSRLLS